MKSNVVKLESYGVLPNSNSDAANAIRQAIIKASECYDKATVEFSEGTYIIGSTAENTPKDTFHSLYFSDIHDVKIQGNNTTFLINDPFMDVFHFLNSSNVTIKGITIDYLIDPWVQGTVVDINEEKGTFTLSISNISESGTTILDDPRWLGVTTSRSKTSPFGMVRDDNDPRLLKKGVPNFFYGFTTPKKVKQGVYEIGFTMDNYKKWLGTNIVIGSKLVLLNRIDSVGAFRFFNCAKNMTVEDCTVYATVGTVFCIGHIDGNLKINNVNTLYKPNSGRWLTSNADGCYLHDIKGSVTVTNCTFEGLSDDGINLYTSGCTLNQVLSPTQIKVTGIALLIPKINEKIIVIDPINGGVRGEATVIKCETSSKNGSISEEISAILTFNTPISGMKSGISRTDGDVVINHSMQAPGTTVANNTFRYGRIKGIKLAVRDAKVCGNTFENLGGPAITLHDIPSLRELTGSYNLLIENNNIKNCTYNSWTGSETTASISLSGMCVDYSVAKGHIHYNIDIKNNTIANVSKHGIYISSAENVTLNNNTIYGYISDGSAPGMSGVTISNANNVHISELTVNDPRTDLDAGIRILSNCSEITIEENKFLLADGVAPTKEYNK